jgi:hypothetical protein
MSQPITTSVTMDAESFQKFRSFDLFHHQKRWQRPLLFAAILLGSSGICLSQAGGGFPAGGRAGHSGAGAPGSVLLHLLPGPAHHDPEAGPPPALLPPPAGRCRPFRLDGRGTGQAPAQPPVPMAGPSRGLPHPGRRVPLRPAGPSLPCQRRGAGRGVGLPEDASPRLPAAGSAVTPLPPLQTTTIHQPSWWFFICGHSPLFLAMHPTHKIDIIRCQQIIR